MSTMTRPRRARRRWLSATGAAVALMLAAWPLRGDDRAERLQEMRDLVRPLRAFKVEEQKRIPVELSGEPLVRWSDPTRRNSDGSLWAFGTSGRPIAIVAVEFYPNHRLGEAWAHEFVSLSTGRIEVDGGAGFAPGESGGFARSEAGHFLWTPKGPGIALRELPDAPVAGKSEANRLRQMKQLAERFSADEYYAPAQQTYTLRLSPHPIQRYHDTAAGIVDGVIFQMTHGTNPEVLLLIEAHAKGATTSWAWAAARLTTAAPTLRLDQKPVWTVPTPTVTMPTDTYIGAVKLRGPSPGQGADSLRDR